MFEDGTGVDVRRDLMNSATYTLSAPADRHLPYAQGVKTNVLFVTKGKGEGRRQHQGRLGLRPADEHAALWQDDTPSA